MSHKILLKTHKQANKKQQQKKSNLSLEYIISVLLLGYLQPYHCCCDAVFSGTLNQWNVKLVSLQRDLNWTLKTDFKWAGTECFIRIICSIS